MAPHQDQCIAALVPRVAAGAYKLLTHVKRPESEDTQWLQPCTRPGIGLGHGLIWPGTWREQEAFRRLQQAT